MPTTLSRASFSSQRDHLVNLKLTAMGTYAVGNNIVIGPLPFSGVSVGATIRQILPLNNVRAQITTGPPSSVLLLPKGSVVT